MRLKLVAPFASPDFAIRSAIVLQAPADYEAAWDEASKGRAALEESLRASGAADDLRLRLPHSKDFREPVGSRYRSIESHSLLRPLHVIEVEARVRPERAAALLREASAEVAPHLRERAAGLVESVEHGSVSVLLRMFGQGLSIAEIDLPVGKLVLEEGPETVGPTLDALQETAIRFAERLVDACHDALVVPAARWAHGSEPLRPFLDGDPVTRRSEGERRCRTLWVSRALFFETADGLHTADGGVLPLKDAIVSHWLKDVLSGAREDPEMREPGAMCTEWLNYLFGEEHAAVEAETRAARTGGPREPFHARWDAIRIAQYYYAAFDLLQSSISRILAISVSHEGAERLSVIKGLLDRAIRDVHMLNVEYQENRKYYSRRVVDELDPILQGWVFEDGLRKETAKRLADCEKRLEQLHDRAVERASLYTDLILLGIGITSVFAVLLAIADYGRTVATDADLAVYETSSVNVADWIAAHSTDAILLAGLVLSLGLILLYVFFRTGRSKL